MAKKKASGKASGKSLGKAIGLVNVSVRRAVVDGTGDFLSAVIVELIHYRYVKNDRKPVWLKTDWIHEALPYISRSGLAKKLKKLEADKHIKVKRGVGRHYHKCSFSPSADMFEACEGKGEMEDHSKVYYNIDMATENLEASVVYATIVNLLKVEGDTLQLDNEKLAKGSGLSIRKIRRAVKWLIDNKKIEAKKVFGNKRVVNLPANITVKPTDLQSYFSDELPSESFPHEVEDDLPTESFPHRP